ncbi:MAG: type VI secretion system baseplate subunit TssF [Nannocystis sp.]|nr:type VI secretion system baseplate subunit TssF [Nannocystis sp.]
MARCSPAPSTAPSAASAPASSSTSTRSSSSTRPSTTASPPARRSASPCAPATPVAASSPSSSASASTSTTASPPSPPPSCSGSAATATASPSSSTTASSPASPPPRSTPSACAATRPSTPGPTPRRPPTASCSSASPSPSAPTSSTSSASTPSPRPPRSSPSSSPSTARRPSPRRSTPAAFASTAPPAVNLFDTTAAPLAHTPLTREHLLRPDDHDPRHAEVHAVTRVVGNDRARGQRRVYSPLHDLSFEPGAPRYALRRVAAVDGGVDTYLLPRDAPNHPTLPDELLSVDLVCSNRDLPLQLGVGDLHGAPPGALFRGYQNLTPITPPIRAPLGDDAQWHLLAHLGLAARGLHEPAALRDLLALHNAPARLHTPLGRSNARQIDAVRGIERDLVTRVHRGAPVRTIRSKVALDEAGFASSGHAFLFTALLDQLLAGAAPFLTASELHAVLHPSAAELRWPPHLAA